MPGDDRARARLSRRAWFSATGASLMAMSGACRDGGRATRRLRVWAHQGQPAENQAVRGITKAFEDAHAGQGLDVELSFFPDYHYTEKLSIAAAAGDMPDAFELDGPLVARFVDAELLAPLDPYFQADELADFLSTIRDQGTIDGRLYALGAFDSAAVLYYDRQKLEQARVALPEPARGFSWPELLAACERLSAERIEPLALHLNESADEWFTYAFSPVIWSGGGRLIAPEGRRVQGVLASPENLGSLLAWQELPRRGFAATDPVDPDPFGSGKVAMDWNGHWMARSHLGKLGSRLGVMALPRIGSQSVAPCGSYCWAISSAARAPEWAARWVRWITDAHQGIGPLVAANGAVPARRSAFARFPEYTELPYALFRQQLEENARPRPRTPFYATLTRHFAAALREIAHGGDVALRLARAEDNIERVIARRAPKRGRG